MAELPKVEAVEEPPNVEAVEEEPPNRPEPLELLPPKIPKKLKLKSNTQEFKTELIEIDLFMNMRYLLKNDFFMIKNAVEPQKMCIFLPAELVEVPPNVEPPNGFLFALAADVDPPPRPLRNPPPPPPPKIEPPPLDSAGLDAPKSIYKSERMCVCKLLKILLTAELIWFSITIKLLIGPVMVVTIYPLKPIG